MAKTIGDGFHAVPAGKLATVVTYLEMRGGPAVEPMNMPEGVTLRRVSAPKLDWYRDVFTRVGSLDWLWTSRMTLDDAALGAIIHDPNVAIWTIAKDGRDEALLELDFRTSKQCEIAFFGLTAALIGTGAGRALMATAQHEAWAKDIDLLHVHTCTLDSPQALGFYIKNGFTPVKQAVEVFADPRLSGDLPTDAGPRTPIFKPA